VLFVVVAATTRERFVTAVVLTLLQNVFVDNLKGLTRISSNRNFRKSLAEEKSTSEKHVSHSYAGYQTTTLFC